MTQATVNPAVVASYTADDIKRQLAAGRTVQQVADRTGWPRQRVTAIINGVRGWMLDAREDKVYQLKGNRQVPAILPEDVEPIPDVIEPSPGHEPKPDEDSAGNQLARRLLAGTRTPAPAAPEAALDLRPRQPTRLLDAIATILGLLDSNDDPAVAKDVGRARDSLARLRSTLTTSEERRQAEADIETAKAALAAAQERLRDLKAGKAPAAFRTLTPVASTAEPTPREIRAWCAANGIECGANGRIPDAIRQQYDTAHNQKDANQ